MFSAEEAGNKKTSVFYRRGRIREEEFPAVEAGKKGPCFLQERQE